RADGSPRRDRSADRAIAAAIHDRHREVRRRRDAWRIADVLTREYGFGWDPLRGTVDARRGRVGIARTAALRVSAPSTPSAEWAQRPERGSLPLMRLMAWVSLRFGRTVSRVPLRIIAAYYLAFGVAARRASRDFLRRVKARRPTLREQYDVFFSFASTIHDRVYFLKDRFDLFDIDVQGAEVF